MLVVKSDWEVKATRSKPRYEVLLYLILVGKEMAQKPRLWFFCKQRSWTIDEVVQLKQIEIQESRQKPVVLIQPNLQVVQEALSHVMNSRSRGKPQAQFQAVEFGGSRHSTHKTRTHCFTSSTKCLRLLRWRRGDCAGLLYAQSSQCVPQERSWHVLQV